MATQQKFDWVKIRAEFMSSDNVTLAEIAKRHGCAHQTIKNRAMRERWTEERKALRRKLTAVADAKLVETRASKLKDWNETDHKVAKAARAQAVKWLNKIVQQDDVDLNALRTVAGILEQTQRIGRLALGATTSNEGSINDPGEDGTAKPNLDDFYKTVRFEGPTEPAEHGKKDDEPPTKH